MPPSQLQAASPTAQIGLMMLSLPPHFPVVQQAWDDLFADAGGMPSAAPASAKPAGRQQDRWFAEADADGDGRSAVVSAV